MATKPIFEDIPEWPEQRQSPPPVGHNKPPLDELIPAEFRATLLDDKPDFLTVMENLVDAASRASAENDDELARCGTLVKNYRAVLDRINVAHRVVKAPYLEAGRLCDTEKNALTCKVEAAKQRVEAIGNAYVAKREALLKAERERVAAEQRAAAEAAMRAERERIIAEEAAARATAAATTEAERDAADAAAYRARRDAKAAAAAAALAPAAPAKSEPVRSDEGATVSGKEEWISEIEDIAKAFKAVKDDPKVREAVEAAVKRLVRAGKREIPGVRVWAVSKANFR